MLPLIFCIFFETTIPATRLWDCRAEPPTNIRPWSSLCKRPFRNPWSIRIEPCSEIWSSDPIPKSRSRLLDSATKLGLGYRSPSRSQAQAWGRPSLGKPPARTKPRPKPAPGLATGQAEIWARPRLAREPGSSKAKSCACKLGTGSNDKVSWNPTTEGSGAMGTSGLPLTRS